MKLSSRAAERPLPKEAVAAFDIIVRELGESVVGVYLFGSALTGGLRPQQRRGHAGDHQPATRRAGAPAPGRGADAGLG
ncbi:MULTISPECIES: hypothetical protein [unclassified Halomonas]|uniref:hypothetical protein n=1 Tax=unclassified Halomonas TaxID=2609666 RepID=UPI0018D216D8|nr:MULTISPECIES: hypothetical protein [unclassified Halomonas]QPP50214.1 hypothetical protein I4484_03560 [Halomonas sp. SS10-MC5]